MKKNYIKLLIMLSSIVVLNSGIVAYNVCSPYQPSSEGIVDLVIYSFDRPMQLEAFLESVERYVFGLKNVTVIYRVSEQAYENAYQKVFAQFSYLRIVKQGKKPHAEFKPLTIKHVYDTNAEYVLFGCDDIIMTGEVDLHFCVKQLQEHNAYTFILRLGENITHQSYGARELAKPRRWLVANDQVRAWRFSDSVDDWAYANSLEMALYKKQDLKHLLEQLNYAAPNSLEASLSGYIDHSKIGMCFVRSKLFNTPVNKVQQENGNLTNNENPPSQLLAQFNQGYKIDISRYHEYPNYSPQQYISLYLVQR